MARYIDADSIMEDLRIVKPITETEAVAFRFAYLKLKDAPTADVVERKRGKWLNKFVDGLGFNGLEFECSECGKRSAGRTNYCAYCGAQMKSE